MNKLKVIIRQYEGTILCLYPELPCKIGNIVAFEYLGQVTMGSGCMGGHFEVPLATYWNSSPVSTEMESKVIDDMSTIYDDYKLILRKRIYYKDLDTAWKSYGEEM